MLRYTKTFKLVFYRYINGYERMSDLLKLSVDQSDVFFFLNIFQSNGSNDTFIDVLFVQDFPLMRAVVLRKSQELIICATSLFPFCGSQLID